MQTVTLAIEGMSCGHCVASVRNALAEVPGVEVRRVDIGSAQVALADGTTPDAALAAVADAGYDATVRPAGDAASA